MFILKGNIIDQIQNLEKYFEKDIYIIGGTDIIISNI